MDWEQFSEKLTRDKKGKELVIIFCDAEDKDGDFVQNKINYYKDRNYKISVKTLKDSKKDENNTISV